MQWRLQPLAVGVLTLLAAWQCTSVAGKTSAPGSTITYTKRLVDIRGCSGATAADSVTPPVSADLHGGITDDCIFRAYMGPGQLYAYTFTIPSESSTPGDVPGSYAVMVQLRTVDGASTLGMLVPDSAKQALAADDPSGGQDVSGPPGAVTPDISSTLMYQTDSSAEEFIHLDADVLSANPGNYTILVKATSDTKTFFTLQVQTPLNSIRLAAEEVAVMKDLYDRCCSAPNVTGDFCGKYLPAALDPNRTDEFDLCNQPPNTCTGGNRLQQLALAGAGLDCGDRGLPPSFIKLMELQTLDLALNNIGGSTTDLAAIIGHMPALRRAFLRSTGVSGGLSCNLVENPVLVLLGLSENDGITGTIPSCFLRDPTLQELYISYTNLTGPLPDVVPVGSPLRAIYAIGYGDSDAPALSGTIPSTFINAADLGYLVLPNHKFGGPLPTLPSSLLVLNVSGNQLDSLPPSLPASLEIMDASFNALTGPIPPLPFNLSVIALEANQLTGPLPALQPEQAGSSRRRLTRKLLQGGDSNTGADTSSSDGGNAVDPRDLAAPSLEIVQFSGNQLAGSIPPEWVTAPRFLTAFDISNNAISGQLPDTWDLPRLQWLDLNSNQIEGNLAPSLAALPSLVYVDASNNSITGSLGAFAAALINGSDTLVHLDLSNNQLTGDVPNCLVNSTILNGSAVSLMSLLPVPRLIDLSNNTFSGGVFPLDLLEALPQTSSNCGCKVYVAVNGPDARLACPTSQEASGVRQALDDEEKAFLADYQFNCTAGDASDVSLLSALDGSYAGDRDGSGRPTGPSAQPVVVSFRSRGQQGGGGGAVLAPGAIAGIAVGSVVGFALLAGVAIAVSRWLSLKSQGWTKETLNGVPGASVVPAAPAFPIGSAKGCGWSACMAARQVQDDAFGMVPDVRGSLSSQSSPSRPAPGCSTRVEAHVELGQRRVDNVV